MRIPAVRGTMFEIVSPQDADDLAAGLEAQSEEIARFFSSLGTDEFFGAQGEYWSPAEHLRHLNKSVRPVVKALEAPRLALRIRFGRSRRGSRSYEEVVESYRQALAAGATAGPYSPSARRTHPSLEEWRQVILGYWREISRQLAAGLDCWDDKALDRYLLPHPLLGKMTVREILFFTLYHNAHHARRVAERRLKAEKETK